MPKPAKYANYHARKRGRALLAQRWPELTTRLDEFGEEERCCTECAEYWPLTLEFFHFYPSRGRFENRCRACVNAFETPKKVAHREQVQTRKAEPIAA